MVTISYSGNLNADHPPLSLPGWRKLEDRFLRDRLSQGPNLGFRPGPSSLWFGTALKGRGNMMSQIPCTASSDFRILPLSARSCARLISPQELEDELVPPRTPWDRVDGVHTHRYLMGREHRSWDTRKPAQMDAALHQLVIDKTVSRERVSIREAPGVGPASRQALLTPRFGGWTESSGMKKVPHDPLRQQRPDYALDANTILHQNLSFKAIRSRPVAGVSGVPSLQGKGWQQEFLRGPPANAEQDQFLGGGSTGSSSSGNLRRRMAGSFSSGHHMPPTLERARSLASQNSHVIPSMEASSSAGSVQG